jgi:hypothetical protein
MFRAGGEQVGGMVQQRGAAVERPACHHLCSLPGLFQCCIYVLFACPRYAPDQDTAVVGETNFSMLIARHPVAANEKAVVFPRLERALI